MAVPTLVRRSSADDLNTLSEALITARDASDGQRAADLCWQRVGPHQAVRGPVVPRQCAHHDSTYSGSIENAANFICK